MSESLEYALENGCLLIRAPRKCTGPLVGNIVPIVERLYTDNACTSVVIGLEACEYLDSTVLGQLLALDRKIGHNAFSLRRPSPEARQILLIVGLDKILNVLETPPEREPKYKEIQTESGNGSDDILRAHSLLSEVSDENAKRFALLIKTLSEK